MRNFTGIIAEYNPFHNGHRHQLDYVRSQGAEVIAVAMSGNFVQRGAPACNRQISAYPHGTLSGRRSCL